MLIHSRELKTRVLAGRDDDIGTIRRLLIDDERWAVRYLVVETGEWFQGQEVLVATASLATEQPAVGRLQAELTRELVRGSPRPHGLHEVSRQYEIEHATYYGYALYWLSADPWGTGVMPFGTADRVAAQQALGDYHVRDGNELLECAVRATDGAIGQIEDFLVDVKTWRISAIVVDTRNHLPHRQARIGVANIHAPDRSDRRIDLQLTRAQVEADDRTKAR